MHNVWLVIQREYLERVRTKSFVILTLLMPAIMAGVILIPTELAQMKSGGIRRIVIVSSNPELAAAVRQELTVKPQKPEEAPRTESGENIYRVEIDADVTDAEREFLRQQVNKEAIDGFLWMTDDAIARRQLTYSTKDVTNFDESMALRNALRTALIMTQLGQIGMSHEQVSSLLKPVTIDSVRIEKGKEGASAAAVFVTAYVMVVLLYTVVLIYGVSVMRSIIDEKSSRIMEVLLASVRARDLMAGKILGVGAVGLTQIVIWMAIAAGFAFFGRSMAGPAVQEVRLPLSSIVFFGVFFVLGYFLYSTMYAAVGAMVNTDQEAQQVQWFAMLPIILAFVMLFPVLQHPTAPFAVWLSLVPFFAPILMLVRVLVAQPPVWQLALCLVLMVATIYGLLLLTSRIYRVGILMYGKRPTLPELRRWLKYAG